MDPENIRSSWKKAGLLLPFDRSEDEAWANKKLSADVQGRPLKKDGDEAAAVKEEAGPAGEDGPSLKMAELLKMLEIDENDSTGRGEGDDSEVEVVAAYSGAGIVCFD